VTAFAKDLEDETTNTVISVTVPETHKITVETEDAQVFYEGSSDEEFTAGRLSSPRLLIRAESGKIIKSVLLNGEDVTDLLHGGYLDLDPVYEDKIITVTTEDEPAAPKDTYTVKGKVTLNGQPLSEVDLELRSTLKTTKTDKNGNFVFTDVEPGEHSLTALSDGKVIGYLSFELKKDNKADVALLEDGTYTVSIDQNGAGVELRLMLNEEDGTLALTEVSTVQKPSAPQTGDNTNPSWWWLLLILSATCIVVLETLRRKKKAE
jgi:hypothetical protein